jgi:hypothetical protein
MSCKKALAQGLVGTEMEWGQMLLMKDCALRWSYIHPGEGDSFSNLTKTLSRLVGTLE